MSELKMCPFCGSDNVKSEEPLDVVYCLDCGAEMATDLGDWNTRPIEDALHARIAELEAELEHVIEVGNYGWDVIRKYGWEEKEINWWNTASDKAYKCLRKGK